VILIGAQALIAAQLGHRFGPRLGAAATDRAETLAGAALILLGVALLVTQIAIRVSRGLNSRTRPNTGSATIVELVDVPAYRMPVS
jgi:hypothetical protein